MEKEQSFPQMVSRQMDIHMQNSGFESLSQNTPKNNSTLIIDRNENLKLLEENLRAHLITLGQTKCS